MHQNYHNINNRDSGKLYHYSIKSVLWQMSPCPLSSICLLHLQGQLIGPCILAIPSAFPAFGNDMRNGVQEWIDGWVDGQHKCHNYGVSRWSDSKYSTLPQYADDNDREPAAEICGDDSRDL